MAIPTTYNLADLMTDFKACASAAGFCSVKFGSPEDINFDHNICYDLLIIDYPSYYVDEGVKEVYTFNLVIGRPVQSGSTQGVQLFDDYTVGIMAELELKFWNMISCLALGISGGGGCKAHIPKHKITIIREKGVLNDNLVVLRVKFDAIANIAVTGDSCAQSGGSTPTGCDDPCEAFFGACGCTDPLAINYDPNAGTDDGTCCYGVGEEPCVDEDPMATFPPVFPPGETSNPS